MKAFYDQNIIDLYIAALSSEQPGISAEDTARHIKGHTKITQVQYVAGGSFRFRIETGISFCDEPICQYVIVTAAGKMKFREDGEGRWFVPGDILFETFGEALDYLVALNLRNTEKNND